MAMQIWYIWKIKFSYTIVSEIIQICILATLLKMKKLRKWKIYENEKYTDIFESELCFDIFLL